MEATYDFANYLTSNLDFTTSPRLDTGSRVQLCEVPIPSDFDLSVPEDQQPQGAWSSGMTLSTDGIGGSADGAETTRGGPRARRRPIPNAVWERVRPVITELHQEKGLPLDRVCFVMKESHGFDAEPQMYKKRLFKWSVRKNYSYDQKMAILRGDDSGHDQGLINGKPIDRAKLRRPIQQRGRVVNLIVRSRSNIASRATNPQLDDRTSTNAVSAEHLLGGSFVQHGPHSRPEAKIERIQLQQSPESHNSELILLNAKQYFKWLCFQTSVEKQLSNSRSFRKVHNAVVVAANNLGTQQKVAFKMLNRACAAVNLLFKEQTYPLLTSLLAVLIHPNWTQHSHIRSSLLRYLAAMAALVLGTNHPVAVVMRLFSAQVVSDIIVLRLACLSADIVDQYLSATSLQSQQFKLCIIHTFTILGEYRRVEMIVDDVSRASRAFAVSSGLQFYLGRIAWQQGLLGKAEKHFKMCVEVSRVNEYCMLNVTAATCLGVVYQKLGKWKESEHYLRWAVERGLEYQGPEDIMVVNSFLLLHIVLLEQEKMDAICKLKDQYWDLCQRWEL